ncbi:MAG: hypothetical protein ACD_28C00015G0001 [uncultured bacterium]|nr:MAG: hypothetical protein ACD_28C00015G0001 [uncultured bacterium]KKT74848.1 MAG: hypothetical protein UW70_C0044G0018 [Candidatus Peregrinibacteria bacterium GW2011_GWA2_44_7]
MIKRSLFIGLFLLAGCGAQNGATSGGVFDESEFEEFGVLVPDTECITQLHGGCVPSDYRDYKGTVPGVVFKYPLDWNVVAADDTHAELVPRERSGDDDVTRLFVWREVGVDKAYEESNEILVDSGKGSVGVWTEVEWEIYTGKWQQKPVQGEWIKLYVDRDNPWINFTFYLITEPENFKVDQAVLKAAVSSLK